MNEIDKIYNLNIRVMELLEGKVVLAFSGGVDSSLLLKLFSKFRKNNNDVVALTFITNFSPKNDLNICKKLANDMNVKLYVKEINILDNEKVINNPIDRCYHCKYFLFLEAFKLKEKLGYQYVVDGSNTDDYKVYRPGIMALKILGVRSPIFESGLDKKLVRLYAKMESIETAKKPSAPCLATRFSYNTRIDIKKLDMIERGESLLKDLDFEVNRIRMYGDSTRIEVEKEKINDFIKNKDEIIRKLKEIGFKYISLDLEGYRSGSMDEVLDWDIIKKLNPWLVKYE